MTDLSLYENELGPVLGGFTYDTEYQLVISPRTNGAFIVAKGGDFTNWELLWVSYFDSSATLYPSVQSEATPTTEEVDIYTLATPWNDDWAIASQRLSGARSQGDTFTHDGNCIIDLVVTTLPTSGNIDVHFREQDANNFWQLLVSSAGVMTLNEVVAGAVTQRGTISGVVANGDMVRIIAKGSTIRLFEGANSSPVNDWISYTSASNFASATAGSLAGLGTGGAVSDVVAWPINLSGAAASALDNAGVVATETPTVTLTPDPNATATFTPTTPPTATPTVTMTPTVTPTPRYQSEVSLSSGDSFVVERKISYGEIAVTLAAAANAVLYGLTFLYRWSKTWIR